MTVRKKTKPEVISDPLDIPPFLRVTKADMPKRRAAWDAYHKKYPPRPFMYDTPKRAEDPSVTQFREQEKERLRLKALARIDKMNRAQQPKQDLTGMRWDSMRNKFVLDGAARAITPDPHERDRGVYFRPPHPMERESHRPERKPLKAIDDIAARVKQVVDLEKFAKANGCWVDKYASLPNPGLIRMSVTNRLRAKVKKGHEIKW